MVGEPEDVTLALGVKGLLAEGQTEDVCVEQCVALVL